MDRFNRSYDSEDMNDELYYSAPAFDPADVLCSGSDSEETPEQVAKKRVRYEEAAQRVVAGHLPKLLSASLKGPFSKKSGWVNPWRQKPRRKRVGEWWQPGSEDMLFTRTNVMKRAADHGLAYLDPEAALQWCKATAQAEADAIRETDLESGAVMISVERDESDESEEMPPKTPYSKDSDQVPHKLRHTDWEHSSRHLDLSMLKYFTETPHTEEATGASTRVRKRPADSEWLRGSYLSKRARWEGSAVPTPTPLLEELQKNGRWRQKSARMIGEPNSAHSSELSTSILNISKDAPQLPLLTFQSPEQRTEYEYDLGPQYTPGPACKSSQIEKIGYQSQEEDIDEHQDGTQRSRRSYHGSSIRVEKTLKRVEDHLFSNLKQDDLVAFTPRTKETSVKSLGKFDSPNVHISDLGSQDLPALRRNSISYGDTDVVEYGGDDSFVTDVVPSSRNLEKFQFRRRARYIDPPKSEAFVPVGDGENDTSISSDGQQEKWQKSISNSLRSEQVRIVDSESPTRRQPALVNAPHAQRTPPESEKSSMSWDLLEVTYTSSFLRAALSPESKFPPNSINSTVDTPLPTPKRTTPRQRLPMAKDRLVIPHQESQELQIVANLAESSQILYDMSTQSFNTTPPRSLPGPEKPHSPPPGAHFANGEAERAVSESGSYAADGMARIQMTLSQVSPNSSFVGSLQSRQQLGPQGFKPANDLAVQGKALQVEAGGNIIGRSPSLSQVLLDKRIAEPMVCLEIEREIMSSGEVAGQDRLVLPNLISANATAKLETTAEHVQEGCVQSYEPCIQVQAESEHLDVPAAGFEAKCITGSESSETRSEAIWEACGPQSPWVIEDLGLRTNIEQERADVLEQEERKEEGFRENSIVSDLPSKPLETEWKQVERPLTPYGSAIKSFNDFSASTPSSDHGITDQANVSLNTQSLVEAATKNPWMSAFRNKSSRELKKRVSFGVTTGGQEGAQSRSSVRKVSPVTTRVAPHDKDKGEVEDEDGNEGIFQDGTAVSINAIGEHLAAATGPRSFKRILPEMRISQLASSPALDAQAEAFIAADRELSSETEWPAKSKSAPSYHLQARSDANRNTAWDEPENSMSNNPFSLSPTANKSNINASTDFDMDEALGAASAFLDDTWNVEIELQKANATDQTGHRRRKLFGLA